MPARKPYLILNNEFTPRSRKEDIRLIGGIALAFLFYPVAGNLLAGMHIGASRMLLSRLIIWLNVGVLFAYAYRVERQPFFLWSEEHYRIRFYLLSLLALFGLILVCGWIAYVPHLLGWHDDYTIMKKMKAALNTSKPLLYFSLITAGVTEELIIRGYMLPRLSLFFKQTYTPVVISAAMFAALHLGYRNLHELLFTFLFGIVTADYYRRYRNINVLIIFHFLFDLMAIAGR